MLFNFEREAELADGFETDSIRILYYELHGNFSQIYKTYNSARMCTITQGEKHILLNSKETFSYDSNHFLLLSPNSSVHMKIYQPTKAIVYEINGELIHKVNEKVKNEYHTDHNFLSHEYYVGYNDVKHILNKVTEEIIKNNKYSAFLIDLFTQELVCHLIQKDTVSQILNFETRNPVSIAIGYFSNNYMRQISIKQLAYDLCMTEPHFVEYFKKVTNSTPLQYLTRLRLEKAKEMLKYSNVTETALNLGYENISYFISIFNKMFGLTPKQYQLRFYNSKHGNESTQFYG
jgi:AraC-type DNA-binding domain-containing proteins